MKDAQQKITIRMTAEEKKQLDELVINSGLSINKTVLNLIAEKGKTDALKSEIASLKDGLISVANGMNQLNENSVKQARAIAGMVEVFKAKGLV